MRELCEYVSDDFRNAYRTFSTSVRSLRTLDEYTGYVNLICNYLKMDFLDIGYKEADGYFKELRSQISAGKLSRYTACVRLSCYKSLGSYIASLGIKEKYEDPFQYIHRPEVDFNNLHANKVPTLGELDGLIDVVKQDTMFYLVFMLASRVGMSATDIVSIRSQLIGTNENGAYYIQFPAKTYFDEPRIVVLPDDVCAVLSRHLLELAGRSSAIESVQTRIVENVSKGCIFLNKHGYPLTVRNIDAYFDKACRESGLEKKYTLKDFRSRAILQLADAGVSAKDISEFTGLKMQRAQSYVRSTHIINGDSPANLSNIRYAVPESDDEMDVPDGNSLVVVG